MKTLAYAFAAVALASLATALLSEQADIAAATLYGLSTAVAVTGYVERLFNRNCS